jgi:hypothetical protein
MPYSENRRHSGNTRYERIEISKLVARGRLANGRCKCATIRKRRPNPTPETAFSTTGPSLLRQLPPRHRVDTELLADMGESFRVGKAPVGHHRAQFDKPRLGKEQPRQMLGGVEPH